MISHIHNDDRSLALRSLLLVGLCLLCLSAVDANVEADGKCALLTMVPFTNQAQNPLGGIPNNNDTDPLLRWPDDLIAHYGYTFMAAAQLAIDHFNARDTSIVPELAQLKNCNVYFPRQVVVDDGMSQKSAVKDVLSAHHAQLMESFQAQRKRSRQLASTDQQLQRQSPPLPQPPQSTQPGLESDNATDTVADTFCPSMSVFDPDELLPPWCAVLGPRSEKAIMSVATVTSAMNIPQLLYSPSGPMTTQADISSTVGIALGHEGRAEAMVSYLQRPGLQRDFLAVITSDAPSMGDLADWMAEIGETAGLKVVIQSLAGGLDRNENMLEVVQNVGHTGMKTILIAVEDPSELKSIATILQEEGMFTQEYLYMLLEESVGIGNDTSAIFGMQEKGSPLDNLLNGAVVISATDRVVSEMSGTADPFLAAWRAQNSSMVELLNDLVPVDDSTGLKPFQANASFFQDTLPAPMASFMYDSVMAAGFGACAYQATGYGTGTSNNVLEGLSPDGSAGPQPSQGAQQLPTSNSSQNDQQISPLPEQGDDLTDSTNSTSQQGQQPINTSLQQIMGYQPPQLPPQTGSNESEGQPMQLPEESLVNITFNQSHLSRPPNTNTTNDQSQLPPLSGNNDTSAAQPQTPQQSVSDSSSRQLQKLVNNETIPEGLSQWQAPPASLQGGNPGSSSALGSLQLTPPAEQIDDELGFIPTIQRMFQRINTAFLSLEQASVQGAQNTSEFVSRVVVSYNETYGYPQRILIVYDTLANSNDKELTYNDFTFFATITGLIPLNEVDKAASPAPMVMPYDEASNSMALEELRGTFNKAKRLWDSHNLVRYQFDYDLFFDSTSERTLADRTTTPYPWRIVVDEGEETSIWDADGTLLKAPMTPTSSQDDNSDASSSGASDSLNTSEPTIEQMFQRIGDAFLSMEQSLLEDVANKSVSEFVSRIQVAYNDTHGHPEKVLIIYETLGDANANNTGRTYDDFTFYATIEGFIPLQQLERAVSTQAPTMIASTSIATSETLEESRLIFTNAINLWNSHNIVKYQFDYDVLFDFSPERTRSERVATPYPWQIVVENGTVALIRDRNGNLLTNASSQEKATINVTGYNVTEELTLPPTSQTTVSPANTTSNVSTTTPTATTSQIAATPTRTPTTTVTISSPTNASIPDNETSQYWLAEDVAKEAESTNSSLPQPSGEGFMPGSSIVASDGLIKPATLVSFILETAFNGASGQVNFETPPEKSRSRVAVSVGAFNIRPSTADETTGLRTYASIMTSYSVLMNETSLDVWKSIPGEDFKYRDGGIVAPNVLRAIENENFLSKWVHIIGLTLFALALSVSSVSAGLVFYLAKDRIMLAGQPPFLYILCFGSALMSAAIFTLSWDESYGWTEEQLSVACALTPWFFFVGHILMFSALFAKLWRIDKVLQFRRTKVNIMQVILPLAALLLTAIVILSVWTAIDPWIWERTLIQEFPAETYGKCTCEDVSLFFFLLAGLMVVAKVACAAMAWKTTDIPDEFSDANSVFYAISTHLQAWFIGIPILAVLGDDSVDATYFGRVLLIWIFSVSSVCMVVVPKIVKCIRVRRNPNLVTRGPRVTITGMSAPINSRTSGGDFRDSAPTNRISGTTSSLQEDGSRREGTQSNP